MTLREAPQKAQGGSVEGDALAEDKACGENQASLVGEIFEGSGGAAEERSREVPSGTAAIEVCGLVKDYGKGRGVFDVSFAVQPGEVFGFLGSNGAGKTVTMLNLMGFIRPDAGTARIGGRDCFIERARIQQSLGYLPGEIACMDEMTGTAFLEFMARMKRLQDRNRMRELVDYCELDAGRRIRKMSKGTKQKVGLVCAFMGRPDILLLDEPTSGLDPLMQSRFIDLVMAEKRRGATIMLSSHLFEEVERTCDRVAFIRAGRLAAVENMDDVRRSRKRVFSVTFADAVACERYRTAHPEAAGKSERVVEVTVAGSKAPVRGAAVHSAGSISASMSASMSEAARSTTEPMTGITHSATGSTDAFVKDLAAYPVADLAAREQSLEELFMHLYGADASEKGGSHE